MRTNGAAHADAAHTAGRNRRQAYQQAYRAYKAAGYSDADAKAKAKADAYPKSDAFTPRWAK